MTTTKIVYVIAAIVPFGFLALACIGIAHVVLVGVRERRLRQRLQPATVPVRRTH
jgi:hypothetical protein